MHDCGVIYRYEPITMPSGLTLEEVAAEAARVRATHARRMAAEQQRRSDAALASKLKAEAEATARAAARAKRATAETARQQLRESEARARKHARGWREAWDPATERVYYFHKTTGEVSWEVPPDLRVRGHIIGHARNNM